MKEIHSSRFKDALWFPKEEEYVLVGGAGGIGSWLTLLLARAGFYPMVFDFDILEEHNLAGQLYSKEDAQAHTPKVVALKNLCNSFADTIIDAFEEKITRETMSHYFVFSAFDNMQARKDLFEAWSEFVDNYEGDLEPILIDGRLTAEQMQIFCVRPEDRDKYRVHLFDDSEVEDAPCTLKQTSHAAAMIGSHMVGFFTNHYTNNMEGDRVRSVPFLWEYFIPINLLTESNE